MFIDATPLSPQKQSLAGNTGQLPVSVAMMESGLRKPSPLRKRFLPSVPGTSLLDSCRACTVPAHAAVFESWNVTMVENAGEASAASSRSTSIGLPCP
jgi:hypothetical protein